MTAPPHMSEAVASAWEELIADREKLGLPMLKPGVGEAAAVQLVRMRDASKRIEAEGLLVADGKGNPVAHPALEVERLAQEHLRRLLG
tara:strand:- start:67 stop:330 length:264 start_codon:yes stop_codon:yes gene_type:complete